MTKTTMPEPVAYAHRDILRRKDTVERIHPTPKYGTESVSLITTDQAEAYAAAKVREALEEAAKVCDARALKNEQAISEADDPEDATSLRSAAWQMSVCARKIRNLLSTPA